MNNAQGAIAEAVGDSDLNLRSAFPWGPEEPRGQGSHGRSVLRVDGLEKRYGATAAVSGLSFEVREGEVFGLLGSNGAGKTTTISMLATERLPSGGDALLFGHSIKEEPKLVRRMIGVAPQDIAIYPMLTAAENLRFFGRIYGLKRAELEERIDELLHFVGLAERRDEYARTLSGGMKRRLNLAVALVHRPKLILLDEATVGVDLHSREQIFQMVRELREAGSAIIYTTHYLEEAEGLCDRLGILSQGKLIAMGTLDDLLGELACSEVIELRGLPPGTDLRAIRAEDGVCHIEKSRQMVRLLVRNATALLGPLQKIISRSERPVRLKIAPVSLEHVFLQLTGREFRE
jgi:linearmycin/streptolysin S transport system ATP-binding protein